MAKAFPPHEGCPEDEQPDNELIPLDTEPMLPKLPDGTGTGSPSDIPAPTGPMAEALPGVVSPPNSEQPIAKTCVPGILKADIDAGNVGQVREMVGAVEIRDPFDALNHSDIDGKTGDKVYICFNDEDDAFFLLREQGEVVCDCDELPGEDLENQLLDYCDVDDLICNLDAANRAYFEIDTDSGFVADFRADFFSDAALTTPIGETIPFNADGGPFAMVLGLSGFLGAAEIGTLSGVSLEITETDDGDDQVSAYGGVLNIANFLEGEVVNVRIVDDTGGFFHLEFFEASPVQRIGFTGTYNSPGTESITPDNGSGLSGNIEIDAVVGVTTGINITLTKLGDPANEITGFGTITNLFNAAREKVFIEKVALNDWIVKIYKDAAKTVLRGKTAVFTTVGSKIIINEPGLECTFLGGSITVSRIHSPDTIIVECPTSCNGECCPDGSCGCSCQDKVCFPMFWQQGGVLEFDFFGRPFRTNPVAEGFFAVEFSGRNCVRIIEGSVTIIEGAGISVPPFKFPPEMTIAVGSDPGFGLTFETRFKGVESFIDVNDWGTVGSGGFDVDAWSTTYMPYSSVLVFVPPLTVIPLFPNLNVPPFLQAKCSGQGGTIPINPFP